MIGPDFWSFLQAAIFFVLGVAVIKGHSPVEALFPLFLGWLVFSMAVARGAPAWSEDFGDAYDMGWLAFTALCWLRS